MEHPAFTGLHDHYYAPSIWFLPYMQVLLAHPQVAKFSFDQCPSGSLAKKRTLLGIQMSQLTASINANSDFSLVPSVVLGGRTASGQFRTAPAKEYPPAMCRAVAQALHSFVVAHQFSSGSNSSYRFLDDPLVAFFGAI